MHPKKPRLHKVSRLDNISKPNFFISRRVLKDIFERRFEDLLEVFGSNNIKKLRSERTVKKLNLFLNALLLACKVSPEIKEQVDIFIKQYSGISHEGAHEQDPERQPKPKKLK